MSDIDDTLRVRPVERSRSAGTGAGGGESKNGASTKRKASAMAGGQASGSAASARNVDEGLQRRAHPPVLNLDILATQHRVPPDLYLVLTTRMLCRFVLLQPVDQLYRLLLKQEHVYREQVEQFQMLYGAREFAAMCLVVICCPTTKRGARLMTVGGGSDLIDTDNDNGYVGVVDSDSAISVDAARRAEELFMNCNDLVENDGGGGVALNQGAAVGVTMASSQNSVFTGRYTGLRQFLGRILRPLWKWSVTVSMLKTDGGPERFGTRGVVDALTNKMIKIGSASAAGGGNWQELRFSAEKLKALRKPLERLRRLLERNAGSRQLACEQLPPSKARDGGALSNVMGGATNGGYGQAAMSPMQGGAGPGALVVAGAGGGIGGGGVGTVGRGIGGGRTRGPLSSQAEFRRNELREQHAVAQLYHLVIRATQALTALIILAKKGTHFPRIVAQLRRADQDSLANLTFEELCTTQVGADVLRKLVSKLMEDLSTRGTNMRRQCIDLKRQCDMFFSEGDTLRMTGRDLIRRARRAGGERARERRDLLIEALRELVKSCEALERPYPDRYFVQETVCEVCAEFCSDELRYYDGVVSLALSCAYHLAKGETQYLPDPPEDDQGYGQNGAGVAGRVGSPRRSPTRRGAAGGGLAGSAAARGGLGGSVMTAAEEVRLRYNLRLACYECVTDMLQRLIFGAGDVGSAGVVNSSVQAQVSGEAMREFGRRRDSIVQGLLERCQDFQDVLFHDHLYSWLTEPIPGSAVSKRELYERLDSPYVEQWLLRMGSDDRSYYDSLIRFYIRHRRSLEAANLYAVMAKREEIDITRNPTLDQRLEWLGRAIQLTRGASTNALQPASRQVVELFDHVSGDGIHKLEFDYAVAQEQKGVLEALRSGAGSMPNGDGGQDPQALLKTQERLQRQLIHVDRLYKQYAKEYRLWSCCLSIIQCTGQINRQIQLQVEKCWKHVFRDAMQQAKRDTPAVTTGAGMYNNERNPLADWRVLSGTLSAVLGPIGRRLSGRVPRIAIPVQFLASMLEMAVLLSGRYAGEEADVDATRAWAITLLHREMGVSFSELRNVYKTMLGARTERREYDLYRNWIEELRQRGPVSQHDWELHLIIAEQKLVQIWLESATFEELLRQPHVEQFVNMLIDDLAEQNQLLRGLATQVQSGAVVDRATRTFDELRGRLEQFRRQLRRAVQGASSSLSVY